MIARQGIVLSWCVVWTGWTERIPGHVPWAAGANQNCFACISSQWTDWIIRVPSAKWAEHYERIRLTTPVCRRCQWLWLDVRRRRSNEKKSIMINERDRRDLCEWEWMPVIMIMATVFLFARTSRWPAGGQWWHSTVICLLFRIWTMIISHRHWAFLSLSRSHTHPVHMFLRLSEWVVTVGVRTYVWNFVYAWLHLRKRLIEREYPARFKEEKSCWCKQTQKQVKVSEWKPRERDTSSPICLPFVISLSLEEEEELLFCFF